MTTAAPSDARTFTGQLMRLDGPDGRATLAALRRCRGHRPGEVALADAAFFQLLPAGVPDRQVDMYWLVAGLYAQAQAGNAKTAVDDDAATPWDLASTLRALARDDAKKEGAARRLRSLLDATQDELEPHLRGVIALATSAGIPIRWGRLLTDLLGWENTERRVQRRWARAFWGAPQEHDGDAVSTTETED